MMDIILLKNMIIRIIFKKLKLKIVNNVINARAIGTLSIVGWEGRV